MSDSDLIELLDELAIKDLDEGFEIEDHPCFIAARRIEVLAGMNDEEG